MSQKEVIDIVDRGDNVLNTLEEYNGINDDLREKGLITRMASVLVFNSHGELLLQKRSKKKFRYPLHWTVSAGGFVEHGEEYIETALREMEEEIGIKAKQEELNFLFKKYIEVDIKHIAAVYRLNYSKNIQAQNDEVDEVKFFSLEKIKKMIEGKEKVSPFLIKILEDL